MMYRKILDGITRVNSVDAANGYPIGKRLHACERAEPFDDRRWHEFLETLTQDDFINYPNDLELRKTIAKMHKVPLENIMLFAGADGALSCIFQCFTEQKTQIIMPEFHFPMYDIYAKQNACSVVLLKYDGLTLTSTTNTIADCPRLVIIANPNSPIGDSPSVDLFADLEKYNVPIVVDSVYSDFGSTQLDIYDKLSKNYIFVHSLSKSFGGAGARVGYVIANAHIISILNKMRPIFPITGASIKFAVWALSNIGSRDKYVATIIRNREKIAKFYPWNIGGNWVHVPQAKFLKMFASTGAVFKTDVKLPNISQTALIRITPTDAILSIVTDNCSDI